MDFIKTIPASSFTLSAAAIGFLLIDDLTPVEQNSVGNWLMLIGQVLETNASQQQVINNSQSNSVNSTNNQIIIMQKMIDAMYKEIENLKRK